MLKRFKSKKKRSLGAFNYNRWSGVKPSHEKRDMDGIYKGFARSVYHANTKRNEFDSKEFLDFFYKWWIERAFMNIKKHRDAKNTDGKIGWQLFLISLRKFKKDIVIDRYGVDETK